MGKKKTKKWEGECVIIEINKKTLKRIFLIICGCIVLYWLLHETERVRSVVRVISNVLSPFVIGSVLAFVLNVPMRAIENSILKKISNQKGKRAIAVVLTLIAMAIVLAGVFWLLIPQVISTTQSLIPSLRTFLMNSEKKLREWLNNNPKLLEWLYTYTNFENLSWSSVVDRFLSPIVNSVSSVFSGAISAISSVFSGVFDVAIGLVFSVYCLFQKENLARQGRKLLYAFVKENTADNIVRILRLTNSTFSNFLSGQCVEVCILGSLFAITMAIFRMPYIPLISVLIAITAFIPIVGAWTGCIVGAFLIFVKDPMLALLFVVMFVVLQFIENNLIYPRVVGNSVGLSGMWVLVAITIGGALKGVLGMFLMIPVASVVYTVLQEMTNKRLSNSFVDAEKLQIQPPILRSKIREKREQKKHLIKLKKKQKSEDKETQE